MDSYIRETHEWRKRRRANVSVRKEIRTVTEADMRECYSWNKHILLGIANGSRFSKRHDDFKNEELKQKLYIKVVHHPFTEEQCLHAQNLLAELDLEFMGLTKRKEDHYRHLVLESEYLMLLFKWKTGVENDKVAKQLLDETPFSDDSDLSDNDAEQALDKTVSDVSEESVEAGWGSEDVEVSYKCMPQI